MRTTLGRLATFSELRFTHQQNEATSTSLHGKTVFSWVMGWNDTDSNSYFRRWLCHSQPTAQLPSLLKKRQGSKCCWRDHNHDTVELEISCLLPPSWISRDELGYAAVTTNPKSVAKHNKSLFFILSLPNTRHYGHIHHTEGKRKRQSESHSSS